MYAQLVMGADQEARAKFDRDLNAPAAGWAAVERRIVEIVREAD